MNPQPEEDLQQRLKDLEAEINSQSSPRRMPQSQQVEHSSESGLPNVKLQFERLKNWFNTLSGTGKLVAASVGVLLGFALVQAVFRFVASAISLALLAGLVYLGYKFLVSSNWLRKQ